MSLWDWLLAAFIYEKFFDNKSNNRWSCDDSFNDDSYRDYDDDDFEDDF